MAVNNSLVKKETNQKVGIGAYLTSEAIKNRINEVVGGKDGQRFISAIVSATTVNPTLQECTNSSILSAALLGESLKLSPSPQLGHYYFVPYSEKTAYKDENGQPIYIKNAQFQLGYKGYIQLAIRSGQYKKLNVLAIKEGELEYFDPLNEEIKINLRVDSWDERESAPTVGYYAFFELVNGFRKAIYWSKGQMDSHATTYSPGYAADKRKGTKYTFWSKDFDGMAYKTMLRQLISKWGIMSTELQTAFESDMAVINEDGTKTYVETEDVIEAEAVVQPDAPETPTEKTEDSNNNSDISAALFGGGQ